MTLHRSLKLMFPTAWAVCLAAGYALLGQWALLALTGLVWLGWLFAAGQSLAIMLVASVSLSAVGASVGAPSFLMLLGATLALASWDLVRWDSFLAGAVPAETGAGTARKHYVWLALALGSGLLAAAVGGLVRVQIPFGVLVAVAVLAFLGLDRVWTMGR